MTQPDQRQEILLWTHAPTLGEGVAHGRNLQTILLPDFIGIIEAMPVALVMDPLPVFVAQHGEPVEMAPSGIISCPSIRITDVTLPSG